MAVPKKRTTSTTQGQRRSHHALKPAQLVPSTAGVVPRRLKRAADLGLISNVKKA